MTGLYTPPPSPNNDTLVGTQYLICFSSALPVSSSDAFSTLVSSHWDVQWDGKAWLQIAQMTADRGVNCSVILTDASGGTEPGTVADCLRGLFRNVSRSRITSMLSLKLLQSASDDRTEPWFEIPDGCDIMLSGLDNTKSTTSTPNGHSEVR